jgi:hypothetical protein
MYSHWGRSPGFQNLISNERRADGGVVTGPKLPNSQVLLMTSLVDNVRWSGPVLEVSKPHLVEDMWMFEPPSFQGYKTVNCCW